MSDDFASDNEDDYLKSISNKENISLLQCNMPTREHQKVLTKNFGHAEFRPLQWKIISSIINENRDVCAVIATGYGKSLCFQYPAVYKNGIVIVVSPLISLMEDQILSLTMSNIPACLLGSAQTSKKKVLKEIIEGQYRVVYVTPEFATGECGLVDLHEIAETNNVVLLAIDEAHCVSQWGHEFRPQFRNVWKLRNIFLNVPILAVTATATPFVQEDIVRSLHLKNPLALSSSFDRPNLYFEVKTKTTGEPCTDLKKCMVKTNANSLVFTGSTIIYCLTQKTTEEIHSLLSGLGISCAKYHGGMNLKNRKEAHEKFVKDKIKCIVATIAFGMGIDKPDVRNIIHYGASKDIESYYQEVGRAGRDGLPAKCTVFFSSSDFNIHRVLRSHYNSDTYKVQLQDKSLVMEKYLNTTECRRKFILRYFEDKIVSWDSLKSRKNCCDNCLNSHNAPVLRNKFEGMDDTGMYDIFEDAKLFLQAVNSADGRYGLEKYCKLLKGSNTADVPMKFKSMPIFGKGNGKSIEWWRIVGRILNTEGYLQKKDVVHMNFVTVMDLSTKGESFLRNCDKILELKIIPSSDMMKLIKKKPVPTPSSSNEQTTSKWILNKTASHTTITIAKNDPNPTEKAYSENQEEKAYRMELYKILLSTRNDLAYNADCSPYMIASNTALMSMSKVRPKSLQEFKSCSFDGMNDGKINKFGQKFIDVINKFCSEKPFISKEPSASQLSESNTTGINASKQFAFIEKEIKIETPENSEPLFDDWNEEMPEITDAALNDIYDNLDESIDIEETKIMKKELEETKPTEITTPNKTEEIDDVFDDDWLDSPKSNSEGQFYDSNEPNDVKECKIITKTEKDDRKQGIKEKRSSDGDEWCAKKKTSVGNRFLNF